MSETIALKKKSQKKVTLRAAKIKHGLKTGKIKILNKLIKHRMKGTGIVLLKHLPHGFYENELRKYFSQFGEVLHVVVCRSMRTGQSKGYAFIHFAEEDVAKIAAETMDNYLMFKKRMIAKFLTPSEAPSKIFRRKPIAPNNIPLKKIRDKMNKRKNAPLSENQYKEKCKEKLYKVRRVTNKLTALGIDYSIDVKNVPNLEKKKRKMSKRSKKAAKNSNKLEETIVEDIKNNEITTKTKSSIIIKQTKTGETLANEKNVKKLSLENGPKKAKSPNKVEQIVTKVKTRGTPKSKQNVKEVSLKSSPKKLKTPSKTKSPNNVEQIVTKVKTRGTPKSKQNIKEVSLKTSPKKLKTPSKAKSPNKVEQILTKVKTRGTPKSEQNVKEVSFKTSPKKLKTPNKLKLIESKGKTNKTPESMKNEKNLSLGSSPRKTKFQNKIETKTKLNNDNKRSLKTISKAKDKITKTKTQRKDVKKLKSALEQYMAENFGKSRPKLRSQTAQNKSK